MHLVHLNDAGRLRDWPIMAEKWLPPQGLEVAHDDGDFSLVPNAPEFVRPFRFASKVGSRTGCS